MTGPNAIGFACFVGAGILLATLIPLYRRAVLAQARIPEGVDDRVRQDWDPPEFEEVAYLTPKQREQAQLELSAERSRILDRIPNAGPLPPGGKAVPLKVTPLPATKAYRQGDWAAQLPMLAVEHGYDKNADGTRTVYYSLPTDAVGAALHTAPMFYLPQRAASGAAVRAEFDQPHAAGLVVEEVGEDDNGFTPFGEGQGPGVIGDDTALATQGEQVGEPAYRRHKIDAARRARHNKHWLADAEATGKLQGAAGVFLQHVLAGAEAAPVAQYLEHAKQLVQRAEGAQLQLTHAMEGTPLGQALVAAAKTSQEGATLALALIDEVQRLQEQRDELACRLIQALPTALDRKREQSYLEGQAEEADDTANDEPIGELVSYRLHDRDKLEGVNGHIFYSRADVLVPLADLHAEGSTRLRVVDEVHGTLLGYVYCAPVSANDP